jgi:hypothetical protein
MAALGLAGGYLETSSGHYRAHNQAPGLTRGFNKVLMGIGIANLLAQVSDLLDNTNEVAGGDLANISASHLEDYSEWGATCPRGHRGGDTTISFSRSRNLVKRFESVKGFRARHDQISSFLERSLSRATQAIGQGSLGSFRALLRVAWRNNPSMAWLEHER